MKSTKSEKLTVTQLVKVSNLNVHYHVQRSLPPSFPTTCIWGEHPLQSTVHTKISQKFSAILKHESDRKNKITDDKIVENETRRACIILRGGVEERHRPLGRSKHKCVDNIKMDRK